MKSLFLILKKPFLSKTGFFYTFLLITFSFHLKLPVRPLLQFRSEK